MDLHVSTPTGQHPFKVLIRSLTGEYLAGSEGQWRLTKDRSTALVCDYLRDHIADQLQRIEKTEGIVLLAELVNPREALEICDRCDRTMPSPKAHFDGNQFLCLECKSNLQRP